MWKNKEFIVNIVENSVNKTEVLEKLKLKPFTGNFNTLDRYIKTYDINISHFNRKMRQGGGHHPRISIKKILIENSKYTSTNHLKERLYKEGLKERKCELCGQEELWNNKKMSLILDHINGKHDDNRIENLQIVCPNCNATLDTHCSKNIKHIKEEKIEKIKKYYYCEECGNLLSRKGKRCLSCFNKQQRTVERPSYEQLINEINELGYCGVGRKYGVSDNAIRKWKNKMEVMVSR